MRAADRGGSCAVKRPPVEVKSLRARGEEGRPPACPAHYPAPFFQSGAETAKKTRTQWPLPRLGRSKIYGVARSRLLICILSRNQVGPFAEQRSFLEQIYAQGGAEMWALLPTAFSFALQSEDFAGRGERERAERARNGARISSLRERPHCTPRKAINQACQKI